MKYKLLIISILAVSVFATVVYLSSHRPLPGMVPAQVQEFVPQPQVTATINNSLVYESEAHSFTFSYPESVTIRPNADNSLTLTYTEEENNTGRSLSISEATYEESTFLDFVTNEFERMDTSTESISLSDMTSYTLNGYEGYIFDIESEREKHIYLDRNEKGYIHIYHSKDNIEENESTLSLVISSLRPR